MIQQVSTTLVEQQSRRLRVEGEYVRIAPDIIGAAWSTLIPRYYDVTLSTALPPITAVAPGHPLLDTGNQAITMINDATAAACGIQCMPTFQFFKDGQMVHKMEGADEATLRTKVAELK